MLVDFPKMFKALLIVTSLVLFSCSSAQMRSDQNEIEAVDEKNLLDKRESNTDEEEVSPGRPYYIFGGILLATGFFTTMSTDACQSDSSGNYSTKCNLLGYGGFLQAVVGGGLIYLGYVKNKKARKAKLLRNKSSSSSAPK